MKYFNHQTFFLADRRNTSSFQIPPSYIINASLPLRIIFHQLQMIFLAQLPYPLRIGASAIEMNEEDALGLGRNGLFNQFIVYLQRIHTRLHENGLQSVSRNGKDGGDKRIGWHNHLIALTHHAHLHIGTINQGKRVKTVSYAHAILRSDIPSIFFFESGNEISANIPPRVYHLSNSLLDLIGM